ncbi:MAG: hypothetical protein FK733_05940, partial [Asgard group archaeon]|nr:hypothetical protein [Asgard group archaeon]
MSEEIESFDYSDDEDNEIIDLSNEAFDELPEEVIELAPQKKKKKTKKKGKREKKQRAKKLRENFAKLSPKKQVLYLTLIVIGVSLIINTLFGVGVTFAPSLDVGDRNGALPALPGNFIVEILLLWVIALLSYFILYPLYPYISVLFIRIHNLIKLKRTAYSRVTTGEHYFKFRDVMNKVISPLLFSFVLGYWIGSWVLGEQIGTGSLLYFLYGFIATPLIVFLMSPLWLLDDAGIITIKKRKEGERDVPDIEGVSAYFHNFFYGSAISLAAVTLYDFIDNLVTSPG